MILRLLAFTACFFLIAGCSTTPDNEGAEAASEQEEGLSEEPMGEEGDVGSEDPAVTSEDAPAPEAAPVTPTKALYDRLGGKATLEQFADKLIDAIAANDELKKNPNIKSALEGDQTRNKQLLADFFCEKAGGPCTYGGTTIRQAFAPLKVTRAEWDVLRKKIFISVLKKMGVKKQERKELALIAAREKKNIVTQ